jgi:hypothetical protein
LVHANIRIQTNIIVSLALQQKCNIKRDLWYVEVMVLDVHCRTGDAALSSSSAGPGGLSPLEAKPVERQVEARPVDDSLGSMVRCLYFAKTFLITGM